MENPTSSDPQAPADDLPAAFYVPEPPDDRGSGIGDEGGEIFCATALTRGPWSARHQHGGPPAALLARAFERRAAATGGGAFQVVRMTVELLRPVPIGRVRVEEGVLRAGRKALLLQGALHVDGERVCLATALALRGAAVALPPLPPEEAPPLPLPAAAPPFAFPFFNDAVGYHRAIELRLAAGVFGRGPTAMWMRLRAAVVRDEEPSALQRVMALADSGTGVSMVLDPLRYSFLNPDLTVYLRRPPAGPWLCLQAATIPEPSGVGLAESGLFDERGRVGRALQSIVVEERRAPP